MHLLNKNILILLQERKTREQFNILHLYKKDIYIYVYTCITNYLWGIVRVLLVYAVVLTNDTLNVIGPNIFLEGNVYQLIHFRYILTPPLPHPRTNPPSHWNQMYLMSILSFLLYIYIYVSNVTWDFDWLKHA